MRPWRTLICIACVTITRFFGQPLLDQDGLRDQPTLATNSDRKVWTKAIEKKFVTYFPSRFTSSVHVQSRMKTPSTADR